MNESELLDRYPHLLFARNWDVRGSSQLSNLLGECVAYIRVLREIPLLPEEHKRLLEVSLRRGALATTAIEGNTLTEADLVRIFDQDEAPTESMNYQKVEVENIIEAMNIIKDDLLRGSESIIEPELIKELHRLITRNLGEKVDCIPGKFREDNRHVGGIYRTPDYSDVDLLMDRLCRWLRSEFRYPAYVDEYGPIIQAVVAHIYLEWIHPFGDGNGRTGRLLEFYIQVRGGIPVVAATLLSNHYNQTRSEYYRHFENARKKRDLTDFLLYAVLGLRDGLRESLRIAQKSVLKITWEHLVYAIFRTEKGSNKVLDRRRELALAMKPYETYTRDELLYKTPRLSKQYATRERLGSRDLNELVKMGLIESDGKSYKLNTSRLLYVRFPEVREGI